MFLALVIFSISFILLLWSGRILPRSITAISRTLRLSEFLIAFFLVSFATSVPELFVGVFSAVQGIPGLSLGNIMGANLINLTLVVGLSVLVAGSLKSEGRISTQNFWLIFLIALLPILLASDGMISRGDGLILLIVFGLYIAKILRDRQYFHKELDREEEQKLHSLIGIFRHFSRFIGAVILLLGSSFALIWASKLIVGEFFNAQFIFFGVIFVALGTTLPEIVFGIRAALSGHSSAVLGTALGSVAFNAAAVVGIVALINPIKLDFTTNLLLISAFLFIAFLLFHFFVYTRNRLSRREGLVLLLLYIGFVAVSFF